MQERLTSFILDNPGLTDQQITEIFLGAKKSSVAINIACHNLEEKGIIIRQNRKDGKIGNYPSGRVPPHPLIELRKALSEDAIKKAV